MIRFAKPLALVLCAALGMAAASPVWAQQSSAAAAKKKAAKAAPAVAAASTTKPADKKADAGPGKPLLVASFGDWGVYQTQAAKGRVCYTLAQPKDRAPADLKRDAAYAFISDRPNEGVRNEISFIMGFDVANPADLAAAKGKAAGKDAMAMVGDQSFELLAKTANLWVKNAAKEGQLIDEMRKGAKLQVMASSKKGHMTTDTYSLSGFSQALDRVQKDCPSK
jgi:D-arabinose 1-dehydrogenase-like Zn-dependent alcohol dehydrogenase